MNSFSLARMGNPQPVRGQKPLSARSRTQPSRTKKRPQKKRASSSSSTASPSTPKKEAPSWSKILSPKNMEESLNTISTLRNFCKQCIRYVQQADGLLDTLYVTTNSLQESGILKKLSESKGKNLNSADFTTMLMALMNSPLGNSFFKRLTGGDNDGNESTEKAPELTAPAQSATPPAARQLPAPGQQHPGGPAPGGAPPTQQGRPPYPGGMQQPPYGYPPGSLPM